MDAFAMALLGHVPYSQIFHDDFGVLGEKGVGRFVQVVFSGVGHLLVH